VQLARAVKSSRVARQVRVASRQAPVASTMEAQAAWTWAARAAQAAQAAQAAA
jgi:hypothetical protein